MMSVLFFGNHGLNSRILLESFGPPEARVSCSPNISAPSPTQDLASDLPKGGEGHCREPPEQQDLTQHGQFLHKEKALTPPAMGERVFAFPNSSGHG